MGRRRSVKLSVSFYQPDYTNHVLISSFRYEILKYLGGGTYGEVLKAKDHKYDSLVAIKMLNNYTSM